MPFFARFFGRLFYALDFTPFTPLFITAQKMKKVVFISDQVSP